MPTTGYSSTVLLNGLPLMAVPLIVMEISSSPSS
jgi:hypothetical protein